MHRLLDLIRSRTERGIGRRGRTGERLAASHLRSRGYRILGRNMRARFGEMDILARDHEGTVAVVEVKTGTPGQALPELRVHPRKQRKLAALCARLARRHDLTHARFRFDVIAVDIPHEGKPTVRHIPGAFESPV